jgi:MoxR-like ATPase
VLCNLFLADELNRATSRTQSALLEAMEEGQVTVDGTTHVLPQPFLVIATQNPTGAAGTQLLPDSQMDRFAVRLSLGYPGAADEVAMVMGRQGKDPMQALRQLFTPQDLVAMQEAVAATFVGEPVVRYIVDLVGATRNTPLLTRGASPRATLAVTAMAKAVAQLRGRDFVVPKDVQEVFGLTVAHRLLLSNQAEGMGMTATAVLKQLLGQVPAPKLH